LPLRNGLAETSILTWAFMASSLGRGAGLPWSAFGPRGDH
jgi:hypothetical protein